MGRLGRQIVGAGRGRIVRMLSQAYADEWFAHYNYQLVANAIRGHHSPATIQLLAARSRHALERANLLMYRLLELQAQPPPKLTELQDLASDKPFKLPQRLNNVDGILKAVLDAERTSIRTCHALAKASRRTDVITHRLAVDLLAASVRGEEEMERLLGDSAPEMTGR